MVGFDDGDAMGFVDIYSAVQVSDTTMLEDESAAGTNNFYLMIK